MDGFVHWAQQLQFGKLIEMLIIACSSLLCITIHETSHGLAAHWLGDNTAKDAGRLTLNPLRHIDLMGLIMMVIAHFGWAKPVPVDMSRFENPKIGMAMTSFAGPLSNVLLMIAASFLRVPFLFWYLNGEAEIFFYICVFLEYTMVLSAGLAVFNLFPFPPLDGSKVLFSLLPDAAYRKLMKYERYGMILLAIALFAGILDGPLFYLRDKLIELSYFLVNPLINFFIAMR